MVPLRNKIFFIEPTSSFFRTSQLTFKQAKKILINSIHLKAKFNPITYGNLKFRQLQGGGTLFGPDPANKVMVNGFIRNWYSNNGTDDTSVYWFKILSY